MFLGYAAFPMILRSCPASKTTSWAGNENTDVTEKTCNNLKAWMAPAQQYITGISDLPARGQ